MPLTKELPPTEYIFAITYRFGLGFESTPSMERRFDSLTFLNLFYIIAIIDCSNGISYFPDYLFCRLPRSRLARSFFPLLTIPSSNQPFNSTTNSSIVFFPRVFHSLERFVRTIFCPADTFFLRYIHQQHSWVFVLCCVYWCVVSTNHQQGH